MSQQLGIVKARDVFSGQRARSSHRRRFTLLVPADDIPTPDFVDKDSLGGCDTAGRYRVRCHGYFPGDPRRRFITFGTRYERPGSGVGKSMYGDTVGASDELPVAVGRQLVPIERV